MRNAAPIALRTFAGILGLFSFAVLAAGACAHARAPKSLRRDATSARGAGPVVGWGMGAPPPMISASAIAVVAGHSCAIQAGTGAVWCWGHNRAGEATPPPSVDGSMGTATAIAAAS